MIFNSKDMFKYIKDLFKDIQDDILDNFKNNFWKVAVDPDFWSDFDVNSNLDDDFLKFNNQQKRLFKNSDDGFLTFNNQQKRLFKNSNFK